ncbi:MAG: sulfatase [Salinirussus sp.]
MSDRPDVFLFVVDSLREDAVDYETGPDCRTPNLAGLAERSVVFDTAITHGVGTAPAMTALLTGSLPLSHGGHWWLAEDRWTVAETLRAAGYRTGAIHTNPNVSRLRNFQQGFDTFDEHLLPLIPGDVLTTLPDGLVQGLNKAARLVRQTPYLPASTLRRKIVRWVDRTAGAGPRFLWTQFMDVHGPYLAHEGLAVRDRIRAERLWRLATRRPDQVTGTQHATLRERYGAEVRYWDDQLGRLLAGLRDRDRLEDALVVLTSDHGDEFREHGEYGHGNNAYEELVRVPLVINPPGNAGDGQRVSRPVQLLDVVPTVLDLAGVTPPAAAADQFAGRSLLPDADPDPDPPTDGFETVIEKQVRGGQALRIAVRTDRWKFVDDGHEGREELYDLRADPNEESDVLDEYPDLAERFRARTARRRAVAADLDGREDVESGEVRDRLERLGYLE